MLIGANSRTVAAAVDAKIDEIARRCRPASAPRPCSTGPAGRRHHSTVATNLAEGALLVIVVLFLLLGNFRAAVITALVIPVAMLMTAYGDVAGAGSAPT